MGEQEPGEPEHWHLPVPKRPKKRKVVDAVQRKLGIGPKQQPIRKIPVVPIALPPCDMSPAELKEMYEMRTDAVLSRQLVRCADMPACLPLMHFLEGQPHTLI